MSAAISGLTARSKTDARKRRFAPLLAPFNADVRLHNDAVRQLEMDTETIATALMVLLFPVVLFVFVKTMYHFWFVVTGVRAGKTFQAGLLGPFSLLVPSLFDERAQPHLRRLNVWLPLCVTAFVAIFFFQWLAGAA